ncbi:MAG: hypothetical protein HY744_03040 [Deltaproteobacteria bacterium]|nr:hypothetical protein [Deltaproteobacteria bacterium]
MSGAKAVGGGRGRAPGARPAEQAARGGAERRVLGRPIEQAESFMAEVAALFAEGAAREAQGFVRLRQLEAELAQAEAGGRELGPGLAAAQRRAAAAAEELAAIQQAGPGPAERRFPVLVGAGVFGPCVLLAVLAVAGLPGTGFLLGVAGFAACVVVAVVQRNAERAARASRQREAAGRSAEAHAQCTAASQKIEQARGRQATLTKERERVRPQRRLKVVGRVHVPVTVVELAGYPIVVDRSGASPAVALRLPDLAASPAVLERVERAVARAKARPVLLEPRGAEPSELGALHGEERELQEALASFSEMLAGTPTVEVSLPVLAKGSGLVRYLEAHQEHAAPADAPALLLRARSDDAAAMARVSEVAARLRGFGRKIDAAVRGAHQGLREVLDAYRDLRADALQELHAKLHEVLFRTDLAYVVYHCPKCNRVPAYLFRRVGIDEQAAHEMDPETLLRALQEESETRERLAADPQLLTELGQSWSALRGLDAGITALRPQAGGGAPADAGLVAVHAGESRLRAMQAQRARALEQFRACLRKAVTGNARPLLDLSTQARLLLDPDTGAWSCALCRTSFDDPEAARLGRMLKVKSELLMPMWNHLWTEKDDFRKSELFRTNEQIQRFIEKEVAALREVSEQYRADMRPVRENLILSTTDAATKREQLEATVQSLVALGAMPAEQAEQSVGRIAALTGGDLAAFRRHAELRETVLNQIPQAVLGLRLPALDPLDVLLTPEALFREAQAQERLRLAEPGSAGAER